MKMDKKLLIWVIVITVGVGLFWAVATIAAPRVMVVLLKTGLAGKVAPGNSYMVGEKIIALTDGKDVGRVSVFVLDKNGKGVTGRKVTIEGGGVLGSKDGVSDKDGKVTAEFQTETAGQYQIGALIDGSPIGKPVTLTFVGN